MAVTLRKTDGKTDLLMQSMTSKLKNKSRGIIQYFFHSVNVFFYKVYYDLSATTKFGISDSKLITKTQIRIYHINVYFPPSKS